MSRIHNVFITGASSGIGLATARALVRAGYEVWGTSRTPEKMPPLEHFHPVRLDLTDPASIREAFTKAQAQSGGIDALINNAGDAVNAPLEVLAEEGMREQFQTLFFGPVELMRLALPGMRSRGYGIIINISSLGARFPIPYNTGYCGAKAALSAATECLRLELTGMNIRAVDLQPGDIATEIQKRTRYINTPVCEAYEPNLDRARHAEDDKFNSAPSPDILAKAVLRLLNDNSPPPTIAVGSFFEARVAPLLNRILPRRWLHWGMRKMYKLKSSEF